MIHYTLEPKLILKSGSILTTHFVIRILTDFLHLPPTLKTLILLTMPYIFLIPFVGHHSSIVIGKGGSTIKKLIEETGCFIKAENANVSEGRPLPFFRVDGLNEKMVNQATIRIQTMLLTSMMRNEKTLKSQNEELTRQTKFLEMKVADEETDVEDTGISDEKDVWIDRLSRKIVGKDQLSSLLDISKDPITSITSLQCSSNDTQEEESDDDSEEEAEEPISVDIGPPKQTLVNNLKVKGKDPCAKSVCTGSPICCKCCDNRCCRCSRSKEWSKFPSGHMVPPKWDNWGSKKPRTEEEWQKWSEQMLENELEGNDPCINEFEPDTHTCCFCCTYSCCRCERLK
jgi:hypothetical protein